MVIISSELYGASDMRALLETAPELGEVRRAHHVAIDPGSEAVALA
jgi:hypothetical protein